MAFWVSPEFTENNLCELVRGVLAVIPLVLSAAKAVVCLSGSQLQPTALVYLTNLA
jgi:hypothetical protein